MNQVTEKVELHIVRSLLPCQFCGYHNIIYAQYMYNLKYRRFSLFQEPPSHPACVAQDPWHMSNAMLCNDFLNNDIHSQFNGHSWTYPWWEWPGRECGRDGQGRWKGRVGRGKGLNWRTSLLTPPDLLSRQESKK